MKIPLTKYGLPQVVVLPIIILSAMLILFAVHRQINSTWAVVVPEAVLAALLVFSLAFFRDPPRECPSQTDVLYSPADGKITDIETTPPADSAAQEVLKVGIFLSVFNVHINRSPCNAQVNEIVYKKGLYKNALYKDSAQVNESNEIRLSRLDNPQSSLTLRQISGAIARRIVCDTKTGRKLVSGEKFGMIKFGSRTEIHLENVPGYKIVTLVKSGDKVKAGLTPIARYVKCQE